MIENKKAIGAMLSHLRQSKKVSPSAFAGRVGMKPDEVITMENGEGEQDFDPEFLSKVAAVYSLPVCMFVFLTLSENSFAKNSSDYNAYKEFIHASHNPADKVLTELLDHRKQLAMN